MRIPSLEISDIAFAWPGAPPFLTIERFEIAAGERVFLFGPSGSGKSTLLNLIAGTLTPRTGTIRISGTPISDQPERARDRIRADRLGVIFQMFNLLPYLSIRDNVLLPCRFSARRRMRVLDRYGSLDRAASHLLTALGLGAPEMAKRAAATLSVGQQQRVAAARALIGEPALVLADEPTSALDLDARESFLELLFAECEAAGAGLLFVSHDHSLKRHFDRSISLQEFTASAPSTAPA